MTEPNPPDIETAEGVEPAPLTRRRWSRKRRVGCGILLVFWFALVMSPCLIFILATQGEIRIGVGGAPDQHVRLWLVMEERERGLGISVPSVHEDTEAGRLCVQTDVRYWLWSGEAPDISYCDCYLHATAEADWTYLETINGQCPAP